MLQQGRYTWRHDSVLSHILDFLKRSITTTSFEIHCDIGERTPVTIPPDILVTTDRPDLVVINRLNKTIWIFELTVSFECSINKAHDRKTNKYVRLVNDLEQLGYTVQFCAFEIGSRGLITP